MKGEKKLSVLHPKNKKAYIKGTFDNKGKALFYFDTKTYLMDGTHLKFYADATEAVTVYESRSSYDRKLVYERYHQISNQTLIFPLSWSGRQYITVEGKKNTSFVVPFKLERLQPLREQVIEPNTKKESNSLVVKVAGTISQKQKIFEKTDAIQRETIDSKLSLEKFTYRTVMQALVSKRQLEKRLVLPMSNSTVGCVDLEKMFLNRTSGRWIIPDNRMALKEQTLILRQ